MSELPGGRLFTAIEFCFCCRGSNTEKKEKCTHNNHSEFPQFPKSAWILLCISQKNSLELPVMKSNINTALVSKTFTYN